MQIVPYSDFVQSSKLSRPKRVEFIRAAVSEPTYVRLIGGARNGTIGKVLLDLMSEQDFKKFMRGASPETEHQRSVVSWLRRETLSYAEYLDRFNYHFSHFQLLMDDGKKIVPASFDEDRGFDWLTGYVGPTVSCFTKLSKADRLAKRDAFVPIFCDALGKLIEVGQFVAVNISGEMTMGTVTEVVKTGKSVRVKGILKDTATLISDSTKLIVIDGETRTRAMLKKLSK